MEIKRSYINIIVLALLLRVLKCHLKALISALNTVTKVPI